MINLKKSKGENPYPHKFDINISPKEFTSKYSNATTLNKINEDLYIISEEVLTMSGRVLECRNLSGGRLKLP